MKFKIYFLGLKESQSSLQGGENKKIDCTIECLMDIDTQSQKCDIWLASVSGQGNRRTEQKSAERDPRTCFWAEKEQEPSGYTEKFKHGGHRRY